MTTSHTPTVLRGPWSNLGAAGPALAEAAAPLVDVIREYEPSVGEDDDELVPVRLADLRALRAALSKVRGEK